MSKELEILEELKSNIQTEIGYYYKGYVCCKEEVHKYDEDFKIIRQALLNTQEQEKVLEVLFKKRIDLFDFIRDCIDGERTDYEWYEMHYRKYSLEKLTQEEFKLLKRYFK